LVVAARRVRAPRVARLAQGAADLSSVDALVDPDVPVPNRPRTLVVGSDPYDDRITCLADLRTPSSLPPAMFDAIALTDARPARDFTVLDNAVQALRPEGVLVCGATWPTRHAISARFARVTRHGFGPWRVVEARNKRADG
jgi:hypothetical protein